jgi:type I restriction enzyme, S subunit
MSAENSQLLTINSQLPDGYKQTDVGVIPNDWRCETLKGKIEIIHGFAFLGQHFKSQGLYRLTTPGHFYENGGFRDIGDKQKYYDGTFPDSYLLRHNDLIVAMTEQADGLLGSAAIIPEFGNYLHNQRLGRIRLISSEVVLGYLYYLFNSKSFRLKVRESAAGTKVKHTSPNKLLGISVPLPPPPEQQAIAEVLSDVDALIISLDQFIAKKRNIKQGALQLLLTGKKRLVVESKKGYKQTEVGNIPEDWHVTILGKICDLSSGTTPRREFEERYYSNGKTCWVKTADLNNGLIKDTDEKVTDLALKETSSLKVYNVGAVLVAMYGGFNQIGRTGLLNIPATINQAITAIQPNPTKLDSRFLLNYLNFKVRYWKDIAVSSRKDPNITGKDVRNFPTPLPPLPEQQAIAQALSNMDAEIEALEKKHEKYKAIKQGMMQELLTGKTRLV